MTYSHCACSHLSTHVWSNPMLSYNSLVVQDVLLVMCFLPLALMLKTHNIRTSNETKFKKMQSISCGEIHTFVFVNASASVRSFQVLFRSLIGLFPTYLPVKVMTPSAMLKKKQNVKVTTIHGKGCSLLRRNNFSLWLKCMKTEDNKWARTVHFLEG